MRSHIDHPAHPGVLAFYGHDLHLGFFVEVHGRHGRRLCYDATYGDYSELAGALAFLAKAGFFELADVYEALLRVEHEVEEDLPDRLRLVIEVVWNFKKAAERG